VGDSHRDHLTQRAQGFASLALRSPPRWTGWMPSLESQPHSSFAEAPVTLPLLRKTLRPRWVVMLALLALSLACTRPSAGPGSGACDGGDAATLAVRLKAQADAWDQAIIRKDAAAIAANMSADFRHISKNGDMADRAAFLKDLLSPDLTIHPYGVEDFDVRVYGTTALLCGRTRMTGTYQGKPFRSHYRYVDTYVCTGGKWVVCQVQITAVPE